MHKLRVDEGEIGKLGLVDVGDDQLVRGRELGLGAREELVKVLCSFATLEKKRDTGEGLDGRREPGRAGDTAEAYARSRHPTTEHRRHCRVGLNLIWATTRCALTAPTVVPHQPLRL